ncbi:MAG: cation transporter [Elusimicrobiota bacterium]|nr:MAG: cation transporter [Elusimicrobiota bacterium]
MRNENRAPARGPVPRRLRRPVRAAADLARVHGAPPGRYTVKLNGLICTVCGRAIAAEWARLPEIESASVNFDKSEALISVRLDRTLKVAVLQRTLRRAEKLANLGAKYEMRGIAYKLGSK